jgi:hypothetical protein
VESTDFLVSNQRDNALLKSIKKLMINTVYYLKDNSMLNFVLCIMCSERKLIGKTFSLVIQYCSMIYSAIFQGHFANR